MMSLQLARLFRFYGMTGLVGMKITPAMRRMMNSRLYL